MIVIMRDSDGVLQRRHINPKNLKRMIFKIHSMSWFNIFKRGKVAERTPIFDRITAEDYIDQGYTCQEIAELMKCDIQTVYNVKQAKTRRERSQLARIGADPDDPLTKAKNELKAAELQLEIDKLKFEREQLEQEHDDFVKDSGPDPQELAQNPENLILSQLLAGFMQGRAQHPTQAQSSFNFAQNAPIMQNNAGSQCETQQVLTDQQITEVLTKFTEQFGADKVKAFANLPDETIISVFKGRMPGFSEDTYIRALGILKKME